jgi:hypothetical protein
LTASPGHLNWSQKPTQNHAAGEGEDRVVFWSDFGGAHTTHRFWVYYLLMSSP